MTNKVRIGDHDETAAEITARNQKLRADDAVRELATLKSRIREFYNEVSFVSFENADSAPSWAPKWLDYLLDGSVPRVIGEAREQVEDADFEVVEPGPAPDIIEGVEQSGV